MKKLKWKSELFSKTIQIFENNSEKGKLINETFSDSAAVTFNNQKIRFYKPDLFSRNILIKDSNEKEIIGNIKYDFWKSKAVINLNHLDYFFKKDSFWLGKWSISDKSRKLIEYESSSSNGMIKHSIENDLLLFTGLYITNNYQKGYYILFFIIIMIPIIMK